MPQKQWKLEIKEYTIDHFLLSTNNAKKEAFLKTVLDVCQNITEYFVKGFMKRNRSKMQQMKKKKTLQEQLIGMALSIGYSGMTLARTTL